MLLVAPALAQDIAIHESLHSGSSATDIHGGTFTGSGWRLDDSNSRMMWDFGTQVNRGSVSVVLDGVTFDNLTGDNNHIIELFDSGGHFSSNRAINVRVYGSSNPAEHGDIKLKVWDEVNGAEARGGIQAWDGKPHTFTVTWDESTAVLYRDGVVLVSLDVSGIDLSVGTFWLPLNDWHSGYSAPIGSSYSDLWLDAWEPGGADEPPVVDGEIPIEDVGVVEGLGGSVYDDEDDLPIEGSSERSYVMFDLSHLSGRVISATLTLTAQDDSSAAGDGGTVYAVSDTSWEEETLAWSARPALGSALDSFGAVSEGQQIALDVTAGTSVGGRVAFAIASDGTNGAHFCSKETDGGDCVAVLKVETGPREEEEPDPETDTDGESDTDPPTDTGTAEDPGTPETEEGGRNGGRPGPGEVGATGCGCQSGPGSLVRAGILLVVLVGLRRR